jgi:hypothetical protein
MPKKITTGLIGRAPGGDEYLPSGRPPKAVPEGKILIHNFPPDREQARQLGLNGFHAWWHEKSTASQWTECDCGWCSNLGKHYTSRLAG